MEPRGETKLEHSLLNFAAARLIVFLCTSIFLLSDSGLAQPRSWSKTNSSLIRIGVADDPRKMPLILIHGIRGTKPCSAKNTENEYWKAFKDALSRPENQDIRESYSVYIFQYCSDVVELSQIALELRDLIDGAEGLIDRNHYIIAHSMGGLVAKSYMTETVHLKGRWVGKTGGDTTLELITLATLHHGTPGANSPEALDRLFATGSFDTILGTQSWKTLFEIANEMYWKGAAGENHPSVTDSTIPNRSDLRWDNYDFKLDAFSKDINQPLAKRNLLFQRYTSKLIAYGGFLDTTFRPLEAIKTLLEMRGTGFDNTFDTHRKLSVANYFLVNGLNKNFGFTDGLVPFKSSLFCDNEQIISLSSISKQPNPKNYICRSPSRVRRFEPGTEGEVAKSELPDAKTLSIFRIQRGYDHLDMVENPDVLSYVFRDLRAFSRSRKPMDAPPITPSSVPTLFLFDVSGSMQENGKIDQARAAGLDALRELREGGPSPVSIMTFAGDNCGGSVTRKLLNFTSSLPEAESTVRLRLPVPNGGTPLPQAKDAAFNDLSNYLNAHTNLKEGRIVLLSDGQSTCGEIRPPGVFSRRDIGVRRNAGSKIKYYTIGFDVPAGSVAERDLQFLASETGGKYYNAADRHQLISAFRKQVRQYIPRPCNSSNTDFATGLRGFADLNYSAAVEAFSRYSAANPTDWCGYYNLALAYEANDLYKKAGDNYQRYLTSASTSPDRIKVEEKIAEMKFEYAVRYDYLTRLISSDLAYLNSYYKSVFNRPSQELAAEFRGFVYEKQDFYAQLASILEVDASWLKNDARDISSSIDVLSQRTRLSTFDRDAVSLLTTPIGQIEDLLERLRKNRSTIIE